MTKVIFIGETASGKSSLFNRLSNNFFDPDIKLSNSCAFKSLLYKYDK